MLINPGILLIVERLLQHCMTKEPVIVCKLLKGEKFEMVQAFVQSWSPNIRLPLICWQLVSELRSLLL